MAKLKTVSVGVKIPANKESASNLALKWQKKMNNIEKAKLDSDERISREKSNLSEFIKPIEDEVKKIEKSLLLYCEANRDELTSKGKYKHGDIGSAIVKWRKTSKVSITKKLQDSIIKSLKPVLPNSVTIKETINKDILNANRTFVEEQEISGINFKDYETFTIEMKGKSNEKRKDVA